MFGNESIERIETNTGLKVFERKNNFFESKIFGIPLYMIAVVGFVYQIIFKR